MKTSTPTPRTGRLSRGMALLAACATVFCGSAWANPLGAQIASGQVSMVTSGNQLVITNTPGAVINWQNFSIGAGELTRFVQQGPNSSVLNRVVGADPSQILGALHSNGKVFLINPNGIVFGAGARVDVNGLVASSLKLSNEDFAAGKLNLAGDSGNGAVHNQGIITTPSGGQVYLIAPNVTNSGLINSPGGDVVLAAGHSVQMADASNPALRVVVSAANDQALNVGDIVAQGGKVGIYGALLRQRGVVNANSAVRGENGQIVFKATGDAFLEAGSVTSTSGGDISVSADNALVVLGAVTSNGGAINFTGESVAITGAIDPGGGILTTTVRKRNRASEEPPPPQPEVEAPSLAQCVANPALRGCNLVLPSIESCTINPTQAGCSAVLPSLNTCIAEPALVACTAVLPTLATCIAAPSLVGCSVVLPSLNTCTAGPTLPGCSVVLPTISICTTTPAAAGCSAVLPSLGQCATNPAQPGCSAVLPNLSVCIATPTAPGCNVVLPSLSACVITPSQAGCSAVLPNLNTCAATPTLPGCSVVLPSMSTCVAAPTVTGCGAVLPSLTVCVATPSVSGCSVVLPGLNACIPNPTLPGCNVVLPTLATCVATPTAAGCTVVLPPIDRCVANPALAGCSVVSPTNNSSPVNQAVNNTVNIINTQTASNAVAKPPAVKTASNASGGADTKTADKTEEKKDEKKDDKKESAAADKTGEKYEDVAKKLYCN